MIPLLLALLLTACTPPSCPAPVRPTRTLWLAVDGTPADVLQTREAAARWEQASCGELALPVVQSRTRPAPDTVAIRWVDTLAANVGGYTHTKHYRSVVIARRQRDPVCSLTHELGHVLRESSTHDTTGLMRLHPRECGVTRDLYESTRSRP